MLPAIYNLGSLEGHHSQLVTVTTAGMEAEFFNSCTSLGSIRTASIDEESDLPIIDQKQLPHVIMGVSLA
jgi:hypothetical protein